MSTAWIQHKFTGLGKLQINKNEATAHHSTRLQTQFAVVTLATSQSQKARSSQSQCRGKCKIQGMDEKTQKGHWIHWEFPTQPSSESKKSTSDSQPKYRHHNTYYSSSFLQFSCNLFLPLFDGIMLELYI